MLTETKVTKRTHYHNHGASPIGDQKYLYNGSGFSFFFFITEWLLTEKPVLCGTRNTISMGVLIITERLLTEEPVLCGTRNTFTMGVFIITEWLLIEELVLWGTRNTFTMGVFYYNRVATNRGASPMGNQKYLYYGSAYYNRVATEEPVLWETRNTFTMGVFIITEWLLTEDCLVRKQKTSGWELAISFTLTEITLSGVHCILSAHKICLTAR